MSDVATRADLEELKVYKEAIKTIVEGDGGQTVTTPLGRVLHTLAWLTGAGPLQNVSALRGLSGNVTADLLHNTYEFSGAGSFRILTSLGASTGYRCRVRNKSSGSINVYLDSFSSSSVTEIPRKSDEGGGGYLDIEIDAGNLSFDGNP